MDSVLAGGAGVSKNVGEKAGGAKICSWDLKFARETLNFHIDPTLEDWFVMMPPLNQLLSPVLSRTEPDEFRTVEFLK
jgi:hypothetical protein